MGVVHSWSWVPVALSPFSPQLACLTKVGGLTNSEGTASSLLIDTKNRKGWESS